MTDGGAPTSRPARTGEELAPLAPAAGGGCPTAASVSRPGPLVNWYADERRHAGARGSCATGWCRNASAKPAPSGGRPRSRTPPRESSAAQPSPLAHLANAVGVTVV